jgi:hypothetical protein
VRTGAPRVAPATNWSLRLEANYQVSDELVLELARLDPNAPVNAYRIRFNYGVFSHKVLPHSIPLILFCCERIGSACGTRETPKPGTWRGHWEAQRPNPSRRLEADEQWMIGQTRYMQRELEWCPLSRAGLVPWLRLRPSLMQIATSMHYLFGNATYLLMVAREFVMPFSVWSPRLYFPS